MLKIVFDSVEQCKLENSLESTPRTTVVCAAFAKINANWS